MTTIDLRECESCGEVVQRYPLFAGVVAILIGALAYAGISFVTRGGVDALEVGLFAVFFGVGYTSLRYFGRTWSSETVDS